MGNTHVTLHSKSYLDDHLVRYRDLIPCTTAFIDTRTPGSQGKENFTIIGPGVSENPDQHVHISRPHGFNIGGARQPPHCINSQHSHDTAEVFVVLSGEWLFTTGEHADEGRVELHPGDTISIPARCFRGFENIGRAEGFLLAVLGGDDPGRVTWAPNVFEDAIKYGLVLLENGNLVDTAAGESIPSGSNSMPITTPGDVDALLNLDSIALEKCVVRHSALRSTPSRLHERILESPIIGLEDVSSVKPPLLWPHGFQVRHLTIPAGTSTRHYQRPAEEVLFVYRGQLRVTVRDMEITLEPGDVFTLEPDQPRHLENKSDQPAEAYVVLGGDTASIDFP